jgi:hypothetical protein
LETDREEIIKQAINLMGHQKFEPKKIQFSNATSVLTNKSLYYIPQGFRQVYYQDINKIKEDLKKKESIIIQLDKITDVFIPDKTRMTPYFRIEYKSENVPKYATFSSSQAESDQITLDWAFKIRRELRRLDKKYIKMEESKSKKYILIDQTHDQIDLLENPIIPKESIFVTLHSISLEFGFESPKILRHRKNEWEKQPDEYFNKIALLTSFGTKKKKYKDKDFEKIKSIISNGGVLFLTPAPPNDPPNQLADSLGIRFGDKAIVDKSNYENGHEDHIIVRDFIDHPINNHVKSISFGDQGCFPVYPKTADCIPLAYSSESSVPPKMPVAIFLPYSSGKIIAVGQTKIFDQEYLTKHDNMTWLENIISYILSESTQGDDEDLQKINYCTNCANKLSTNDMFCGECGTRVQI